MKLPRIAFLFSCALFSSAIACSDSNNPDGGTQNKDGQADEDGSTQQGQDGGFADALPGSDAGQTDTGVQTSCNPLNGSGCTNPDICIFVPNLGMEQCRQPAGTPIAHEQTCNPSLHDCAAGYTCVQFTGEANATCRKLCAQEPDCANVTGQGQNGYFCGPRFQNNPNYGVCVALPDSCEAYNDMCPVNEACGLLPNGETGCVPEGTGGAGASCTTNGLPCTKGNICLNFGQPGDPKCYEACDAVGPNTGCANPTDLCQGFTLGAGGAPAPFGICVAAPSGCSPYDNQCPAQQNCEVVSAQGATGCVPEGTGQRGQACSAQTMGCQRGSICLDVGSGPTCYEPCNPGDPNNPPCTTGTCGGLSVGGQALSFGICQ